MEFETTLIQGTLIKRYKRFLADVRLADGSLVTAHTPNTGRMQGCTTPGSAVWLSASDRPGRKHPYTWEIASDGDELVGIHTGRANRLAEEVIIAGRLPDLAGYERVRREVRYGERSRIDLLLEGTGDDPAARCYVEVKNVTLGQDGRALFPDAVTARGRRHLLELRHMVEAGARAAMVFVVQRTDCHQVEPADTIDPDYGAALREALREGVEGYGLRFAVSPTRIEFSARLPLICD